MRHCRLAMLCRFAPRAVCSSHSSSRTLTFDEGFQLPGLFEAFGGTVHVGAGPALEMG